MVQLRDKFLKWPSASEREDIASRINTEHGFECAIGAVDGTTFELKYKPREDSETYFSRKSRYCIAAQIVCDDQRLIRYALVGFPGSVHDSMQLRSTEMYKKHEKFFTPGEYLLGDSAYGKTRFLLTPYKSPDTNIRENRSFNYFFSRTRICIEHTIGMLKSRFPRLQDGFCCQLLKEKDHKQLVLSIYACIIIHNICILSKDESVVLQEEESENQDEETYVEEDDKRHEYDDFERFMFREKIKYDVLRFNNYN